ncbi:unnamed protein product [Rotaria magnacalcarata]|uniref:Uncharacterized protein n=1 Tax=Rotaria magnacalcarata TaxID=392030 RepID=A0A8S3IFN2_9BILA|nr:unnamed protein product [Rotaria magnacalcarata]
MLKYLPLKSIHNCKILKIDFFQGQTYRGLSMTTKDIDDYKWVAYEFARGKKTNNTNCHRVICEFHFDRSCSTAIDLRRHPDKNLLCLSAYEDEAEVLVLPGTLFKVHDVSQEKDTGRYTIVLQNIHVPLNIILEAFKELQI